MTFGRFLSLSFSGLSLLGFSTSTALAQNLENQERTNGNGTLEILSDLKTKVSKSQAFFENPNGTLQALVLTEDGYILTQASEANALKPWKLKFSDQSVAEPREVRRDSKSNLLLLHVSKEQMQAIEWTAPKPLVRGQWLWSLTQQNSEVRLGAVSAQSRPIPNSGVVLGVRFAPNSEDDVGLLVEEVAQQGPAFFAGLQSEDLILMVDDQQVQQPGEIRYLIENKSAGDEVKIHYLRRGKGMECSLRLASKDQVMYNWTGEDFANHGTSLRTDNFPWVLQHHTPLLPSDMGGAVFNLEGKAVGINIARVDRVTNYALPVESFEKTVMFWIEKDRAQRKNLVQPTRSTGKAKAINTKRS